MSPPGVAAIVSVLPLGVMVTFEPAASVTSSFSVLRLRTTSPLGMRARIAYGTLVNCRRGDNTVVVFTVICKSGSCRRQKL